ncbi:hypothetical protein ASPCAL06437 [Aspergillus calidoustus]|uniref:C3H1-type domain-containing protein n=1 Tax=Aspergillus calidoustus TaxID=454130 RepID=A0A0U5G2A8_ASPCI|nr:hypothetical protein ASPCAL06437 [Aspergillus calidoustus]
MSSLPRPQFFCTRPNGALTPLIAVDELPAHITIRGAPRVLSPNETQGMTSLGSVSPRGQAYTVEGTALPASRLPSTSGTSQRSRNHDIQSSLMRVLADENIPTSQRIALQNLLQQNSSQSWQANNPSSPGWLVSNTGGSPGSGSGRQNPNYRNIKKEYCSYWIRHGECDYQQQGCLYKHEMPLDRSMLEKLGLRDIPRWYREKYNVASLLPSGHGHPRPHTANSQPWKEDTGFKTIQYPLHLGINGAAESSDLEKSNKQAPVAHAPAQQQHQQMAMLPGASQIAYRSMSSPTAPVTQTETPKSSPGQLGLGTKKIDILAFDHPDYMPGNNLLYRPSNENRIDASQSDVQVEDLVRNLQSLGYTPASASTDYHASPFDATVGSGRSTKTQRSRRLYQPRSQDPMAQFGPELVSPDSLHAFQSQTVASSSSASVTSKTASSQLASPVADAGHGTTTSEPPTRGVSPIYLSPGHSPNIFRGRGKDKANRRALGAIGQKKCYKKKSAESSEDDLFFHGGN